MFATAATQDKTVSSGAPRHRSIDGRRAARGRPPDRNAIVHSQGSASVMAMVGSALVLSLRASFSSCDSVSWILSLEPLLWWEWLERKLKVLLVRGRCWPGAMGSWCAEDDISTNVREICWFLLLLLVLVLVLAGCRVQKRIAESHARLVGAGRVYLSLPDVKRGRRVGKLGYR